MILYIFVFELVRYFVCCIISVVFSYGVLFIVEVYVIEGVVIVTGWSLMVLVVFFLFCD